MTKEEINLIIAEELGYGIFENYPGQLKKGGIRYPDFCEDLNAMHEAEKTLKGNPMPFTDEVETYFDHLLNLCLTAEPIFMATALNRAIAFVKTKNRWKDNG